jgi:hypothetical protein
MVDDFYAIFSNTICTNSSQTIKQKMEPQKDLLADELLELNPKRRKELLPWWIKIFAWIFVVFGAIAPFALIAGLLHYAFQLSILGLETNEPLSITGIVIISIFAFKGITAYGLIAEKSWAVKCGIVDAIVGIVICLLTMMVPSINHSGSSLRGELILLIPYLIKMFKIKDDWEGIAAV